MDDLVARIRASIENRHSDVWFPDLTADLAARAWECMRRDIGLTPDIYGTERVLSHRISAPRDIIKSLTMSVLSGAAPATSIETLSPECTVKYHKKGISFYSPAEIHTTVLSCVEEALAMINQVPSLMRTVAVLVRSLHLIKPEDEDHDVSFSEPHAPFSIFVSVPARRIANDSLRVAEAIVHEAMHLQLTLIEQVEPLIRRKDGGYFSPWRRELRNAQGLIHGLYVFSVIAEFLVNLNVSDYSGLDYVSGRRSEIGAEINQIWLFSGCSELTSTGSAFVGRLLDPAVMNCG